MRWYVQFCCRKCHKHCYLRISHKHQSDLICCSAAEDDDFVWNMLSDMDVPSGRGEDEEDKEDYYFTDEY